MHRELSPSCINSNCDMHTPLSVQIPEERMLLAGTGEETCTFVLFLENHAHYSIKYFLIDRSLPLPISFIHWLYAISIIQEEITGRFALQIVLFLIFSLSFFFLFFFSFSLLDKSLFEVMFNTVAIFRRITVWLWRPFFDSKTRRNKDQIIYIICVYIYAPDNAPFGKCILFNVVQAFFSKVRT